MHPYTLSFKYFWSSTWGYNLLQLNSKPFQYANTLPNPSSWFVYIRFGSLFKVLSVHHLNNPSCSHLFLDLWRKNILCRVKRYSLILGLDMQYQTMKIMAEAAWLSWLKVCFDYMSIHFPVNFFHDCYFLICCVILFH